jgi:hypothetical protein
MALLRTCSIHKELEVGGWAVFHKRIEPTFGEGIAVYPYKVRENKEHIVLTIYLPSSPGLQL